MDGWRPQDLEHMKTRSRWEAVDLLGKGLALGGTAVVALGLDDVAVLALGAGLVALGGDQALVAALAI